MTGRPFLRSLFQTMTMNKPERPLVAVVGTTGTGKSQLAIELALHLQSRQKRAEVINADAMQCYRGLDVVTNKVTDLEAQGVPHHLMSFLDLDEAAYNIGDWQRDAIAKVSPSYSCTLYGRDD